MSTVQAMARSGLDVAAAKLSVSASNVANALTPGFVPSRVTSSELPGGGAVPAVSRVEDPVAAARADQALLAASGLSGTDLVSEIVAQSQAARLYQANLASLRTADELADAALRLKP